MTFTFVESPRQNGVKVLFFPVALFGHDKYRKAVVDVYYAVCENKPKYYIDSTIVDSSHELTVDLRFDEPADALLFKLTFSL